MIAYFNGQFVEHKQISISPDDRGFLFADGVYEVVRSYDGNLFEPDTHFKRLEFGLQELRIGGVDMAKIRDAASRLIRDNQFDHCDAMVYFQITRGSAPRAHRFPPAGTPPTVYGFAKRLEPNSELHTNGAKAILVPDQRWCRCDIKSTALLANVLANQRAIESGVFEALFVRDGVILEGSHTSVLFLKDGTLMAAPLNNYVLPSVSRKVALELAGSLKIPVAERPVYESELPGIDEVMLAGTTIEILPVVQIDGRTVGTGKAGPVTTRLRDAFAELTGKLKRIDLK